MPRIKNKKEEETAPRSDVAHIVQTIHKIFQDVDAFSKYAFRAFGVSGPQIWALRTLSRRNSLTMGDLAEAMHLHISTVSGIVDRMEKAGYAMRERDTEDRRVVHLRLTPRGRAILPRLPEPPRSRVLKGVQRLSKPELHLLRGAVDRLARIMQVPTQKA